MSHREFLESELDNFQIELPPTQKLALASYCDEVARWNKKINLTALSDVGLVRRLVAEPVWIARELQPAGSLVDIGSGNGSPGVPFQIVCPFRACHLIEARGKRASFLRHLAMTLKLPGVIVHRVRFEDVAAKLEKADWISLQAVALSKKLVDSIRLISRSTTTIVWITSGEANIGLQAVRTLTVPITGTRVFLFQRDLS